MLADFILLHYLCIKNYTPIKYTAMKKIFTLLFCVAAMAFAANANEPTDDNGAIDRCINIVLGIEQPSTSINSVNYDVNNDGCIDVCDVTMLIAMKIERQKLQAPAQQIDVDRLIKDVLESPTTEPNINDVNNAIDNNLRNNKN